MNLRLLLSLLIAVGMLFLPVALHAANVTWDATPGNGVVNEGSGTWKDNDVTYNNWTTDGGVTNQVWNNTSSDIAILGETLNDSSSYNLDIVGTVKAAGLVFNRRYRPDYGAYNAGDLLVLTGTNPVVHGNARIYFYGKMANDTGTQKVTFLRDGAYTSYIYWNGSGDFTCPVQIGDDTGDPAYAKQIFPVTADAFGPNCPELRIMNGSGCQLRGAATIATPLTLRGLGYNDGGALMLYSSGSGWTGDITLVTDSRITARGTDTGTVYLTSDIGEAAGDPKSLSLGNSSYGVTMEVAGTNTYTGDTVIYDTTGDTAHPFKVLLKASGSIANSAQIEVGENCILDVLEYTSGWALGANQRLCGGGTVNGDVTGDGTNDIGTGCSLGQLDITGYLHFSGTLHVEYDSSTQEIDVLAVSGELDLSGGTIDFSDAAETPGTLDQEAYVFATYGSLAGSAPSVENVPSGYIVDFDYEGNQIALLIPEPSTIILLVLAGLTLVAWKRR